MRIGIDARFYGETGPGRYVKNVLAHLENQDFANTYYVFLRDRNFELYIPKNPKFHKVRSEYSWYSFKEQIFYFLQLLSYHLDLFYVPHFSIPVLYPGKLVSAIPDLIMHTYSNTEVSTLPGFLFAIKKLGYYFAMLVAVIRSSKIIVPSNATKAEFLKHYAFLKDDKFVLAYEGVDPELKVLSSEIVSNQVLNRFGIRGEFLLYVSNMYKHKNVKKLIDAFEILKNNYGFEGQLVLVGKKDAYSQKIHEYVVSRGLEQFILLPGLMGFVTDAEVSVLRRNARAYVFPSLMEGFSLTPLEAMAEGLVCAVSNIPCHQEIFGDSVVYFDPLNASDIAVQVQKLLTQPALRENLKLKGYELVKNYDWKKTAQITLGVFKDVLKF